VGPLRAGGPLGARGDLWGPGGWALGSGDGIWGSGWAFGCLGDIWGPVEGLWGAGGPLGARGTFEDHGRAFGAVGGRWRTFGTPLVLWELDGPLGGPEMVFGGLGGPLGAPVALCELGGSLRVRGDSWGPGGHLGTGGGPLGAWGGF
jgi:hypothetical protein